jgi:2-keto-4-pentenoate hydratase
MDKVERIAERLAEEWFERARYSTLTGDLAPADLTEAYRAQRAVQVRLGARRGPVAGRKIALSSRPMQEMVGIGHPVAGAFFASDVLRSPAKVAAAEFRHLGVEFELALELARDVTVEAAPHDRKSVRALVGGARPAFELIEDFDADYDAIDAFTLIAANAWCGGVVLGEPIVGWDGLDLADLPATVRQDGREPERVNTGAADPLGSLAWVLNHCAAQGTTVRAGEHVITGSATRTRFPVRGDRLRYEIDGRAAVEMVVV